MYPQQYAQYPQGHQPQPNSYAQQTSRRPSQPAQPQYPLYSPSNPAHYAQQPRGINQPGQYTSQGATPGVIPSQYAQHPPQQLPPSGTIMRKRPNDPGDLVNKGVKKKRPTDRTLPSKIEPYIPESALYSSLLEFEKRLDATIMRKRMDIQEAIQKPLKTKRTLRIFLSNLASDQPNMLNGEMDDGDFGLDPTSSGTPSWTLRIEGRLLDPTSSSNKKFQPARKFTSFFKSIIVELQREQNLYPEGNIIEWHKPVAGPDYDGVEIKRKGDTNTKAKIILKLDYTPRKFKLSEKLADTLGIQEETESGVVSALWQYVKANKLQDLEDRRLINADQKLIEAFALMPPYKFLFQHAPQMIKPQLTQPDDIELEYNIRVDKDYHLSRHCYDIEVELDDALRAKMQNMIATQNLQKEIMHLDDKIVQCVQSINNSKIKRDFLLGFVEHPVEFINKWVASQARDLEIILGESRVNIEEMRKTDFYKQPWVKEAVFHYLTAKNQQRMQELLSARGQ